ncbi:MAG TPA: 23S rRNA (adenine(2503)-C(2))-methyltransferase RlmN [candidate division Zixibacteria bacterium]|nr:23S rRNA (adenine(2503)-C(2))-methyltransferase RlmN [candidate division Zixibacteria bacterium]
MSLPNKDIDIPKRLDLLGLPREELEKMFFGIGERPFRAKQILKWIYRHRFRDFEPMTDMPIPLRVRLAEDCSIGRLKVADKAASPDGATKLAFALDDGAIVEAVHIPAEGRHTACLSTQVGCALGCKFCATGAMGFVRNLTSREIVGQLLGVEEELGIELTNVVLMGMGEPLMNFEAVSWALDLFSDDNALALGHRRTTLSTVGIPAKIDELLESGLKPKLAISLNAPNDKLRAQIMPEAVKIASIAEILDSASRYATATARWFTVEYVLLGGVNDSITHADALAELLIERPCKVNLIKYNPVEGKEFHAPKDADVENFLGYLCSAGLTATLRQSKGAGISAACGQLASSIRRD